VATVASQSGHNSKKDIGHWMAPGRPGSALTERPAGAGPGPTDARDSGRHAVPLRVDLCPAWGSWACVAASAARADGANELRMCGVGALPSPHAIVS